MKVAISSLIVGAVLLLLTGVAFRSYASAQGVPLLGADARVFLPQTVPFYERGDLINQVWWPAAELDPLREGRMVYHGFLYPMLVSLLMWKADYLALAGALAIVHAAATLLVALLLLRFARLWQWKLTTERVLLILLLTAACANYTQGALGRAEPLAAIILMLGVIIGSELPARWHGLVAALGIGLVTAVDPVIGIFGGLAFGGYAAWRFSPLSAWLRIAGAAALSIAVFAACFLWYPYTLPDWLEGTLRMNRGAFEQALGMRQWRHYLYRYVTCGSCWMLAGTLPLVLWSGIRMARLRSREGAGPSSPALFYVMLLFAGAAMVRFVFYVPWASYNLLPLMPLGFVAVFHELGREGGSRRDFFRPIAIGLLLLASLGFAGDLYERAHIFRYGLTLPEARERFAEVRAQSGGALIGLHRNLFTLTENYSGIVFGKGDAPPERADIWVYPQAFSRLGQPPPYAGFRLVKNYFNPRRMSLFGLPIWRFDRGCGFAVYERENSAFR